MEPYWLSEEQAEAAGDLMAAAFFTAPGLSFMFPNPARRKRLVPPFFAAMARLAVRCGEARALGEPLHAVALWMSPGREHPTQAEVAEAGMGAAVALLDAGEAGRLKVFRGHFDATHERMMDRPHWYLSFLAVAPDSGWRRDYIRARHHSALGYRTREEFLLDFDRFDWAINAVRELVGLSKAVDQRMGAGQSIAGVSAAS